VYSWLWRTFPGGLIGKLLCSLALAGVAVAVLFLFVFPRVESALPFQDVTVDGPGASAPPSPGPG
jgi:hypothetical protein